MLLVLDQARNSVELALGSSPGVKEDSSLLWRV